MRQYPLYLKSYILKGNNSESLGNEIMPMGQLPLGSTPDEVEPKYCLGELIVVYK